MVVEEVSSSFFFFSFPLLISQKVENPAGQELIYRAPRVVTAKESVLRRGSESVTL